MLSRQLGAFRLIFRKLGSTKKLFDSHGPGVKKITSVLCFNYTDIHAHIYTQSHPHPTVTPTHTYTQSHPPMSTLSQPTHANRHLHSVTPTHANRHLHLVTTSHTHTQSHLPTPTLIHPPTHLLPLTPTLSTPNYTPRVNL